MSKEGYVRTSVPKILGGVAVVAGLASGNLKAAAAGSIAIAGAIGVDLGDKVRG